MLMGRPAAFGGVTSATSPPSSATPSPWAAGRGAGASEVTLRTEKSMVARLEVLPRPSPLSGRGAGRGGTLTDADLRKNLSLCWEGWG